jgi:hypothetical protein
MMMLVAMFNFIDGIVAIVNPKYFYFYYTTSGNETVTTHHLVFGSLNSWGWAVMILGIIQLFAALAIFAHYTWGAVVGIIVVSCNAIAQLLWIGVYPWWSVIAIIIDVLVLYALAVYGVRGRSAESV